MDRLPDPVLIPPRGYASRDGTLSFGDTLRNIVHSDRVRRGGEGSYTLYLQRWFGRYAELVDLIRCESLRDELPAWLRDHVPEVPGPMVSAIRELPRVNRSDAGNHREWYDDELRRMIEVADARVIGHFGYTF